MKKIIIEKETKDIYCYHCFCQFESDEYEYIKIETKRTIPNQDWVIPDKTYIKTRLYDTCPKCKEIVFLD